MPAAKRKKRTLQQGLDGVIARQIIDVRNRQQPRLSQEKLAEVLGVTQATITRMESGDRAITVAELFQIAAALDCAPIYLLSAAFTGEDVPVTKTTKLSSHDAAGWVMGETPLPGGNDTAYLDRNIPDDLAAARRAMAQQLEVLRAQYPDGMALVPTSDPRSKDAPITFKPGEKS